MGFSTEQALDYLVKARADGRLGHAYLLQGDEMEDLEKLALNLVGLAQGDKFENWESAEGQGAARVLRPESKSRKITVEAVRSIESAARLTHMTWPMKVGVILGADCMGEQAENAFLKTLEEPPPDSLLLLLTSQPEKLLPTTLSRCIKVPLLPGPAKAKDEGVRKLLTLLAAHFARPNRGVGDALRFLREFAGLLEHEKTSSADEQKAQLASEKERYGDAIGGEWLERREVQLDAVASAEYLRRRGDFIRLLAAWFGDAARIKGGGRALECAEEEAALRAYANEVRMSDLLRRQGEMEKLHEILATTVSEPLALETVFAEILA